MSIECETDWSDLLDLPVFWHFIDRDLPLAGKCSIMESIFFIAPLLLFVYLEPMVQVKY